MIDLLSSLTLTFCAGVKQEQSTTRGTALHQPLPCVRHMPGAARKHAAPQTRYHSLVLCTLAFKQCDAYGLLQSCVDVQSDVLMQPVHKKSRR